MIKLNLLHPIESTPIQTWKFEAESIIRIGRSGDNDVILYSSVVSRYHVEIHYHLLYWEVVNIGANGIFIDNQQIDKERVYDGMTIRLATTGPKLQFVLDGTDSSSSNRGSSNKKPLIFDTPTRPTFMPNK